MYRLYGIPARYAAGYMVQPSAFGRQEDGLWKAVVTDEAAHAWVEIFLEDYGWTPVEVTPSGDGDSGASYPGFDNVLFRQLVAEKGWNLAGWEPSPGEGDLSGEKGSMEGELSAFSMDYEKYEKWLWLLGALGAYSLCLLPFFLDYRRLKGLKKMESWDSRRVFSRALEMLRFAGMLSGYDGTETDWRRNPVCRRRFWPGCRKPSRRPHTAFRKFPRRRRPVSGKRTCCWRRAFMGN